MQAYETIIGELRAYNPNLLEKPRVLVLNKIDLLQPEHIDQLKVQFADKESHVVLTSAATGEGTNQLVDVLFELISPNS